VQGGERGEGKGEKSSSRVIMMLFSAISLGKNESKERGDQSYITEKISRAIARAACTCSPLRGRNGSSPAPPCAWLCLSLMQGYLLL
jgi:hypothetical protein